MGKSYYVYMLMNKNYSTIYTGITSNLSRRLTEHNSNYLTGFSHKYNTTILVYYEVYLYVYDAINREKKLKKWRMSWKEELIMSINPKFRDLSSEIPIH